MDKNFLEFLGNFFMNAAKGQKHLEDMAQWVGQGLKGSEDLTTLFRKCYGLDRLTDDDTPTDGAMWEKAASDFQKSFKDWLSLYGFVPKQDYLSLVEKYEALKEEASRQEDTIQRLRLLCRDKFLDPGEMVKDFQDLMQKQSDQFRQLIENLRQSPPKGSP